MVANVVQLQVRTETHWTILHGTELLSQSDPETETTRRSGANAV